MNYDLAVSLLCAEAHVPDPIYPAYRANPAPTTNDVSTDDCSASDVSAETSRDTGDAADIEGIERSDDKSYWWDGRSWREYDPD